MRRIFGVSAADAMTDLLSFLFRPAAFFVRIWRANEWWRLTFPVAVILKRLAAPLCVFSFMWFFYFVRLWFCRSRPGLGSKYCDQIWTFHLWPRFHSANFRQLFDQSIQKRPADGLMDDFASPEKYSCLNLVALFQKSDDVIFFEIVIVIIRVRPKLYFLDDNVLLVFLGFVKFLVQLVKILSVVHDPANRWCCSRRYLYQVQAPLFSNL